MSSRESTPLSNLEDIHEDTVSDKTLKGLLRREIELQDQIDAIQVEITQLEEKLGTNNSNDLDEQGKIK
jgi:mRNA (2'-O-methyladenosine-N6-)-methyltransferase